mgnify:CR=1 FL=1
MHRCTQTARSKGQDGVYRLALGRSSPIAAFFGALFYTRMIALPWLNGEGEKF